MANRQLQHYGCMAVGRRVEYARLDNPLKDDPKTICTEHLITAIRECETGVLVTLKGASSTIVQAFDSHGRVWGGFGSLCILQEVPEQVVIGVVTDIHGVTR